MWWTGRNKGTSMNSSVSTFLLVCLALLCKLWFLYFWRSVMTYTTLILSDAPYVNKALYTLAATRRSYP